LDGAKVAWLSVGFSTSSAKHSRSIAERLNGPSAEHRDCDRVEQVFGPLVERKVEIPA
jgi:hypothetical protein